MTPQQANEVLRAALKKISETRFGWDGDCGVTSIANEALEATADCAPAPTEPAAYMCPNDPDAASAFKWPKAGANLGCGSCKTECVPLYRHAEPAVDRVTVDHEKIRDAAYSLVLNKKDQFKAGWPLFVKIADEVLATPASPAVPGKPLIWQTLTANAFVGYEEYSTYRREIEGLTRRANAAVQAVPAPAPLGPSDDLRARFEAHCHDGDRLGTARYGDKYAEHDTQAAWVAVQTLAADPAPQLPQASQPTSTPTAAMHRLICQLASLSSCTPEAVNLLIEEAKRVMGKN